MVLLCQIVVLFLVFEKLPYCFPLWLHQFTFPPVVYKVPVSPRPHQHLLYVFVLRMALLTDVRENVNSLMKSVALSVKCALEV